MTRDDIIRLGRESQRERFSDGGYWFSMEVRDLERFAALVAAAAEQPKPEPPQPHGYAYRYRDGIRFNGGNRVNGGLPVEVLPYWFAPPDTEALRRENERLRSELAEAEAVRERCNERAFRLEAEVERLRDELRQSSIDITRAEVERLRLDIEAHEALYDSAWVSGVKAGWNFCADGNIRGYQAAITSRDHLKELRRIREARAALRREDQ